MYYELIYLQCHELKHPLEHEVASAHDSLCDLDKTLVKFLLRTVQI